MSDLLSLPQAGRYGAILADPPWHWKPWAEVSDTGGKANITQTRAVERHYDTMRMEDIAALPVADVAAPDAVLFLWFTWPLLEGALGIIKSWGFTYKTCAFSWMKADVSTIDMFPDPKQADMLLGFWTRANSEACLLATRGKPKRRHADVRQGIIEPRRQHSRKPDCVYGRIERLVSGPYLEMFARQRHPGWDAWGNQTDRFSTAPKEAA